MPDGSRIDAETLVPKQQEVAQADWTPRAFFSQIVEALKPLRCSEGYIKHDVETAAIVDAVQHLIGHYTVFDAVHAMGMLRIAEYSFTNSGDGDSLATLWFVLRDFVCSADATSPACASARATFVGDNRRGLSEDCRVTVFEAMRRDVIDFGYDNWDGALFGGRNAKIDSPNEEEPWWRQRARILKEINN